MPNPASRSFVYQPDPPKREPSPGRRAVLDFVQSEIDSGRPFPSTHRIAQAMGWVGTSTASAALVGLQAEGHVRRVGFKGRFAVWELVL